MSNRARVRDDGRGGHRISDDRARNVCRTTRAGRTERHVAPQRTPAAAPGQRTDGRDETRRVPRAPVRRTRYYNVLRHARTYKLPTLSYHALGKLRIVIGREIKTYYESLRASELHDSHSVRLSVCIFISSRFPPHLTAPIMVCNSLCTRPLCV